LFGAVCSEHGTGAALVLPACNSEAMQLHFDEIATKVTPGARAIILLDQAGWHGTKTLKIPSNISLLPLPPPAPLRLEHADRPALENDVSRTPRLGNHRSFNLRIGISSQRAASVAVERTRCSNFANHRGESANRT
jgi:hypothetical protein